MKSHTYKGIGITKNEFGYFYVQGCPVPFKTLGSAKAYIDRMGA